MIQFKCIEILKLLTLAICLFASFIAHTQNTATIGSEALNDKAVLTLMTPTGDQGLILPIVENKENINPTTSEKGMLVYEDATSEVYLWNGSQWINIVNGGNVDIGLMNDLEDVNTEGAAEGDVLKWTDGMWAPGPDETGSGDALWSANGEDIHFSSGNVGVGTADPVKPMHILADSHFPMRVESVSGPDSGIEFANEFGTQGYMGNVGLGADMAMGTVDGNTTGNLLFLTNNLVRMNLSPAGNLGIGMIGPAAKLHIRSSEEEAMRIENFLDEVRLDFYNGSGYIGYVGSNWQSNIDFGTASDNTTGAIRLRTQNTPRFAIDPEGNVGVGVLSPGVQLDVRGGHWDVTNTEGDFRIGNSVNRLKIGVATGGGGAGIARIRSVGNANQLRLGAGQNDVIIVEEDGIQINGEFNISSTGASNILPVAYGWVSGDLTVGDLDVEVFSGSGNFEVQHFFSTAGQYRNIYVIKVDGVEFSDKNYVAVVTPMDGLDEPVYVNVSSDTRNDLLVSFTTFGDAPDRELVQRDFSFVVYKP